MAVTWNGGFHQLRARKGDRIVRPPIGGRHEEATVWN